MLCNEVKNLKLGVYFSSSLSILVQAASWSQEVVGSMLAFDHRPKPLPVNMVLSNDGSLKEVPSDEIPNIGSYVGAAGVGGVHWGGTDIGVLEDSTEVVIQFVLV